MLRAVSLGALVLVACGDAASSGFSTGPGVTSVFATTGGSSTGGDTTSTGPADDSAGSSASTSTSTSTGTGTLRDVGTAVDFGPAQPPGCKGKVDLLFVISRLGTMVTEQEQLLASFPGFIDTIEDELEGFDVHIMTANPDAYWPGWTCQLQSDGCQNIENWPTCGDLAPGYDCKLFPDMVTPCDEQLGAGLIFNAGGYAANQLCDLHGGNRYIISGEPDMKGAFECIAKVGASGKANKMGDAVIAALSPALNDPGKCNGGFLREDALLVVVLISDHIDESKSYAKGQYEAVVTAKGDAGAVVMLAVVPQPLGDREVTPGCSYDEGPLVFEELVSKFPYAVVGDTCSPSYAPFFADAMEQIHKACESFVPQ